MPLVVQGLYIVFSPTGVTYILFVIFMYFTWLMDTNTNTAYPSSTLQAESPKRRVAEGKARRTSYALMHSQRKKITLQC